nr:MAG TPA: Putative acetylornithine deacetylase [Caudoviricetes sp.]
MKFETITIQNPKTHKNMNVVLKHNKTDKLLCSCNGTYTKASDCNAFVFDVENRTLKCPECGKGNVVTYTVTDTEIIQCRHMGDFKTGVAIPYTENLENLIKEFYILNEEFWG